MDKIVIDGLFLTEKINGVQRYGLEIVKELDRIVKNLNIEIAVPPDYQNTYNFQNIPIRKVGKRSGKKWEQLDLAQYLRKEKAFPVFFENIVPILYAKGIVAIHDVIFKSKPQYIDQSIHGRISTIWRRLNYFRAVRSGMRIVTVSAFSKKEIIKYYHVKPERITVIPNAWQQVNDIEKVQVETPEEYYFSLSTLSPHKNFKWIVNAAKCNPDKQFLIAGGGNLERFVEENGQAQNLKLLGYVSDEEAKAYMAHCAAFLFPTLYEGFGIPPMEALAVGAKAIVVSDIEIMHEVYGKSANYVDPFELRPSLKNIMPTDEKERKRILNDYSWKKSAQKLYQLLIES